MHRPLAEDCIVPEPDHVARAGDLDLQDFRAEIGQMAQPNRPADGYPQRNDSNAIERKRHFLAP